MKLSENFTYAELTKTSHKFDNTPDNNSLNNLKRLALKLEEVRSFIKKPIIINSAYRSKKVNDAVGSTDKSQHLIGCAADFVVKGLTPDQVVKEIMKLGIKYDQLIREHDSWIHISIPNLSSSKPRMQALIIDKNGSRPYK